MKLVIGLLALSLCTHQIISANGRAEAGVSVKTKSREKIVKVVNLDGESKEQSALETKRSKSQTMKKSRERRKNRIFPIFRKGIAKCNSQQSQ